MKKPAAILLLSILLFNWVGYRFIITSVDLVMEKQLEENLEAGLYNEEDLFEIRVPLSLPYQTNWSEFEYYKGEIEIEGIHYKYVKRKVYNDSLILLCIPNHTKMRLQDAKSRFFELVNDLNANNHSAQGKKKQNSFKSLTSDCITEQQFIENLVLEIRENSYTLLAQDRIHAPVIREPERPPAFCG